MFRNAMPRYEILSEEAMETLDRGWQRIVSELGIEFVLPQAVELLRDAEQIVEDENPGAVWLEGTSGRRSIQA